MTRSMTAIRKGIPNVPSPEHAANLILLCERVLEPIRDLLGAPLNVLSGYRSPEVNAAVGGAARSQHLVGQACDFTSWTTNTNIVEGIAASEIPYDQLLLEFGDRGWVHVSWSPKPRHEVLRAFRDSAGRTQYSAWEGRR
jgi:zinc D-Ala-D-Ala carboxypeptidase